MKKTCFYLALLSLMAIQTFAQSSVWKVSYNGNTVFVGGTIHLLRNQDFPLPEAFNSAYEEAQILVFETDISKLETPEFQQKLMANAMYPGDSSLSDVLTEETAALLEKQCNDLGLSYAQMQKLRPSMIILTIIAMHYQKLGINSPGVDAHFHRKAQKDAKEVLSLESIQQQIDLITKMGSGNEDKFVGHSLEDLQRVERELTALISAWREGDTKQNEKQLKEMKRNYPDLYVDLLIKRNEAWLPQIESYFDTEAIEYVLVGNLHLHGKDGILHQLQKRGYGMVQVE